MRHWPLLAAIGFALMSGCAHGVTPAKSMPEQNTPDARTVFYCNGLKVVQDLLEVNEYNLQYKLCEPFTEVKYITIHNTANKATAQNERDYLNRRRDNVSISFHFAVDENEAIQIMPLLMHAWHAGDGRGEGNMNSIAIEICRSTLYDGDLYPRAEENAVKLAAYLLYIYRLDVDDLRMHYNWSGKKCPHRIIEDNRWDEFKMRVAASLENLKRPR